MDYLKKILLLAILVFLSIYSNAQVISGKVIDGTNTPVEFATVILQTTDSVYLNSAYTDSLGVFRIESDATKFRLIVQHLMFNPFDNTYSTTNVGTLHLSEKNHSLGEVVVKGERPLVKIVDGRMTYDMPQLLNGKVVSNAYESLLQLPGVMDKDGMLTLAGASNLTVIVNGKPTTMSGEQLMEMLKNTPKERIEKAEVMYSAPPQYHIRGAAINLVFAQNMSNAPHWQAQVNTAYEQKKYGNYTLGTTLLYSSSNLSLDFLYTLGQVHTRSGLDLYSHHLYEGTIYDIEQFNEGYRKKLNHNIRFGADYKMADNSKINLAYTSQIVSKVKSQEKSKGTYSNSVNLKKEKEPEQMHNLALNYSSRFGLEAGIDYTYYLNHSLQHFEEKLRGKEDTFEATAKQNINRFKAYADQSHDLGNEWNLNYGLEFSYASDHSSQIYKSLTGKDLSASDTDNKLKEYTYNVYAGFEKSFSDKFSMQSSVMVESYKHEDLSEWSVFPQFQATYVFSPSRILQLSVSSDKTYPDYWEMQGNIGYMNGYTEVHGNPQLKPYKNYSAQLTYILNSKYTITAYCSYNDDYFVQLPYQSSNKLALIYETTNFDYKQQIGISSSVPFKLGALLDSRFTLTGYYDKAKSSNFHDMSFSKDHWATYVKLNNTINISSKPNIKMEVNGRYTTKNIQGLMTLDPLWSVDAGVKWTFAGDKAELRLKGVDLFDSWAPDMSIHYANQNLSQKSKSDSRSISISFTYKLGGYKEKDRKDVDTSRFGN